MFQQQVVTPRIRPHPWRDFAFIGTVAVLLLLSGSSLLHLLSSESEVDSGDSVDAQKAPSRSLRFSKLGVPLDFSRGLLESASRKRAPRVPDKDEEDIVFAEDTTTGRALPPPPLLTPFPKTIEEANGLMITRRVRIVRSWVSRYEKDGFVPWKDDAKLSLRMIGAGLYVFAYPSYFSPSDMHKLSGLDTSEKLVAHKEAFQAEVRAYLRTASAAGRGVGTEDDYDFVLKEILPILYVFKDFPDVLDNDMVWYLLSQGNPERVPFTGEGLEETSYLQYYFRKVYFSFVIFKLKQPETENHVLMIYGWRYLASQFIKWIASLNPSHPRYDGRILGLYQKHPSFYANGKTVTDFMLQILGRVLHSDLFETNAKPYEGFSISAIMNIFSFADKTFPNDTDSLRVKKAAQNALDYLAARFAFQSLESKRIAPMRRERKRRAAIGYYDGDYVPFIFGTLSGAYRYNDLVGTAVGQEWGFALWSALLDYRLPDGIHDFMINKHTGYWARMHSSYGTGQYAFEYKVGGGMPSNQLAKYFNPDGSVYVKGDFSPVIQFYFVTPDFINVAGGQYRRVLESAPFDTYEEKVREYDVLSRPNTIVTKGKDDGHWGDNITLMEQDLITLRGQEDFWESRNLATYKSLTVGYYKSSSSKHTHWPHRIPPAWELFHTKEMDFSIGSRAHFRIYDFTGKTVSHPMAGYYVIVGKVSQNHRGGQYREYARGLYEVVPGSKFATFRMLRDHVVKNNDVKGLDNNGDYYYTLASTGEKVQFYRKFGSSASPSCHTFQRMWDSAGREMDVSSYQVNNCDLSRMEKSARLMDVWEVDKDYQFTGRQFASSSYQRGKFYIRNPFVPGSSLLTLDSSNYSKPVSSYIDRTGPLLVDWKDMTYNKGALDISCGGKDGQDVFIVGPEDYPVYGSYIYTLKGTTWTKVFGQAVRGGVDKEGQPWQVNREGDVWQLVDGSWTKRESRFASDIGVGRGPKGNVVVIGMDGKVYKWESDTTWEEKTDLPVEGERVSVDEEGRAWVVGKDGSLWQRWDHGWRKIEGFPAPAHDIGIGEDGRVMITAGSPVPRQGKTSESHGYDIFLYRGENVWEKVGGQAKEIAVCGSEEVWVVRADKSIGYGQLSLPVG